MNDFAQKLAAIDARSRERARADAVRMAELDPSDPHQRCELDTIAHKLAGISGTLGYKEISASALELEASLVNPLDTERSERIFYKTAQLVQMIRNLEAS